MICSLLLCYLNLCSIARILKTVNLKGNPQNLLVNPSLSPSQIVSIHLLPILINNGQVYVSSVFA